MQEIIFKGVDLQSPPPECVELLVLSPDNILTWRIGDLVIIYLLVSLNVKAPMGGCIANLKL